MSGAIRSVSHTESTPWSRHEDALEAGAGVDRRLRQRRAGAVGRLVVLHEDEVPELHEAVAVRDRRAGRRRGRTPGRGRCGARCTDRTGRCRPSARSCPCRRGAGCAPSARRRRSCQISSASSSLSWTVIQMRSPSKPQHLGDELPALRDGQLLEVVAEAEVAEHLEEHEVALGAPDVVEVVVLAAGADALLRADGPA